MAGTNRKRAQKGEKSSPVIILVEPQLPENIGMAARAMANFGVTRLRLVCPREAFPNSKAVAASSKAHFIIENTIVFESLAEAVADLHYILATTARERDGFKPVLSAVEAADRMRSLYRRQGDPAAETLLREQPMKTGILFGRERFGLSNEELSLADDLVTFPVNPAFASLNIAQAVLLMCYEWQKSGLRQETETVFRGPEFLPARKENLHSLFARLEEALAARGYFRPLARKPIMISNLRAVLTRAGFADAEIRLLNGIVSSLDRFSRKNTNYADNESKSSEACVLSDTRKNSFSDDKEGEE